MEVHPLSATGRTFTMILIVVGLGTVAYGLGTITAFWVEGDLSHIWEKRLMERRIAALSGHVIVCGGGETGRAIARELLATRTPFVVIEIDPSQEPALRKLGTDFLYLLGDATDADVLRAARIETARGLITCMPADKDNLFTMLTAREVNGQVRIVSRVASDESGRKLLRAGADAVVSSKTIGALRLASEMLRPQVVSVLDAMLREPGAVRVEEVQVGEAVAGRPLASLRLQERAGVIVFAMRAGANGEHVFNPAPDRTLEAGDVLIACADHHQLERLQKIVAEG
jgi:voltage-gated potassium channel